MQRAWLPWVIAANLVVGVALTFVYPHLMVSPGALVQGHAELATDCFACHAPWRGAASERCVACHALPDIGLRTTKGVALVRTVASTGAGSVPNAGTNTGTNPTATTGTSMRAAAGAASVEKPSAKPSAKAAFHQELVEQDCMACHSDHAGPKLTQRSRKPFSHALLRTAVQQRCESCHAKPVDTLHKGLTAGCAQCHSAEHWKPATFDHAQLFVLDRDHQTTCETCHTNSDYSRYTCYGCHEHTPANVRREHEKEGIRDFQNCVECHRDPGVEPEKRGGSKERGKREKD